ncbi:MAG: hypothetical protein IJX32_00235, partial [Spirochaetaceae bacterium]|nr:hypothetical protein [Spirochaetaceae bacterium]
PFTTAISKAIKEGFLSDYLARKSTEVENMLMTEYDYDTDIAVQREEAYEDGLSKGLQQGISQGIKQGITKGISQGISQGIKQGMHQEKLETARMLLSFGDSIEKIATITGLSLEVIQSLKGN